MIIEDRDGKLITPCKQCKWYNGDCEFGRLKKYKELNLAEKDEIYTFCNYARDLDSDHTKEKVVQDNKIRYDLIIRANESNLQDIKINIEPAPKTTIISYTDSKIVKTILNPEFGCDLKNKNFVQIFNKENRLENELDYGGSQFIADYNPNYVGEAITELDQLINQDLQKIVLYYGAHGFIVMRYFLKFIKAQEILPTLDNFILAAAHCAFRKQ